MPCPDFPCIFGIVSKVLCCKFTVLITDQPVLCYYCWIKFHLEFYIFADGKKGCCHLVRQNLFCFPQAVNIRIVSVSFVSQGFHFVVLDISCPESKHRQKYAGFFLFCNQFLQFFLRSHPYVQIPIGSQNDPVISSLDKILLCNPVSRFKAPAPIRSAACFKSVKRAHDPAGLISGHSF